MSKKFVMRALGACVVVVGCAASSGDEASGGTSQADTGGTNAAATSTGETAAPTSGAAETGDTGVATGDTGEVVLNGACPADRRVGGFVVAVEHDYSAFNGVVADGVVPITVLEPVGEGGGCVLLRRNNPICDPPCQPSTTCDFSGECIPYPQNRDVGTVTVTGLVQPVEVMPVVTFDYFDTTLMHPAFAAGDKVTLSASGGDFSAFTMHGEGVAMIVPAVDDLSMKKGQPLQIAWEGGDASALAQVHIDLTIDQHGNTPVKLVCDGPDTGTLEVPAELVAQFIDFGISGFPSAQFYRQTVDSVEIDPGCVEFTVLSHAATLLSVEGHTPCNTPQDCPEGQVCDILIQTCK